MVYFKNFSMDQKNKVEEDSKESISLFFWITCGSIGFSLIYFELKEKQVVCFVEANRVHVKNVLNLSYGTLIHTWLHFYAATKRQLTNCPNRARENRKKKHWHFQNKQIHIPSAFHVKLINFAISVLLYSGWVFFLFLFRVRISLWVWSREC